MRELDERETHRSQAECPEGVMLTATTVARLALGVARGVTAATRRSMEGTRTGVVLKARYKRRRITKFDPRAR